VGAGLLAKAVYQWLKSWLTHRFREQARSHISIYVNPGCWRKASIHWPLQIIPLADLAETLALYSAGLSQDRAVR
jgi:hypothetical protein